MASAAPAECPFCRISCQDESADNRQTKLFSDDKVFIVEDIAPHSKHHYLVIPREHLPSASQLTSIHNDIGEHIDYNGYGVLPMALEHCVRVAAATVDDPTGRKLCLRNVDEKYRPFECPASSEIHIDVTAGHLWHHYFLCGYRGVMAAMPEHRAPGMCALVSGSVPPSAGLSSSSALVCAGALATLRALAGPDTDPFTLLDRVALADVCARSERFVGTQGGGMDQAACLLAKQGYALRIDFNPLRTAPVQLPSGVAFVVCHSLAELNKAATGHFNTRVAECRVGTKILAATQKLDWRTLRRPSEVQAKLGYTLDEMVELVNKELHEIPYNIDEICQLLEVTQNELIDMCLTENTKDLKVFELCRRLRHVYSEAGRVEKFSMAASDTTSPPDTVIAKLAKLMNQSQLSCHEDYSCSGAELDELCAAATAHGAGALGARLTGAGWGGCVVCLVKANRVDEFVKEIGQSFYKKTPERWARYEAGLAVFATQPAPGAVVNNI